MLLYEEIIRADFQVVTQSHSEFQCYCPWHDDSPSGRGNLYINGHSGFFFCHSCHTKGKLDDYAPTPGSLLHKVQEMQREGIAHQRALRPTHTLPEGYLAQFSYQHPYWGSRGLSGATVELFNLGFDITKNHAVIPFRDHVGDLKGVIRRTLNDDEPWKYKNPQNVLSNHYLFGAHLLDGRRKIAIVEGPVDALACWNARVPAVAVFGSYVSDHQVQLLRRLGIYHAVMMFDDDAPGRKANYETWNRLHHFTVSRGVFRPYWGQSDPGALKPPQLRKMFHSAKLYQPL